VPKTKVALRVQDDWIDSPSRIVSCQDKKGWGEADEKMGRVGGDGQMISVNIGKIKEKLLLRVWNAWLNTKSFFLKFLRISRSYLNGVLLNVTMRW